MNRFAQRSARMAHTKSNTFFSKAQVTMNKGLLPPKSLYLKAADKTERKKLAGYMHDPNLWINAFNKKDRDLIRGLRILVYLQTKDTGEELVYDVPTSLSRTSSLLAENDLCATRVTMLASSVQDSIAATKAYEDKVVFSPTKSSTTNYANPMNRSFSSESKDVKDSASNSTAQSNQNNAAQQNAVNVFAGDCLDCAFDLQKRGYNPVVLSMTVSLTSTELLILRWLGLISFLRFLLQTWPVQLMQEAAGPMAQVLRKRTCSDARSTIS
jgi:hypothetical protein